jgi:subtilisin family serine protease
VTEKVYWDRTEEGSWESQLADTARAEATIIVRAFREEGIEIGVARDLAVEDPDVTPHGIAFMYAKDHILTREQYLGGDGGNLREPQNTEGASKRRGVVDILRGQEVTEYRLTRIVRDVALLCLNPRHGDHAEGSKPEGDRATPGGGGGTAEPEQHNVLDLLNLIDDELGVGIATPDQVVTAANGAIGPCSASEPEEVWTTAGPYPAVCRDGGARVRIFVADTGLLHDAAAIFPWLDGVRGDDDPRTSSYPTGTILPYGGHGTFVAGVLRCMAPEAQIHVANIFNIAGSALESDFVRRLNKAFGFGFEILHLTASCMTRNNVQLVALETWLELLESYKGVVCVAPAGNNDTRRPSWPGAFPGVISVGALATDWRSRAYFSDYGGWVDVYAPGQKLVNAFGKGTYTCKIPPASGGMPRTFSGLAQWSGTSFSAPIVTGLIAARMARCGESAREAAAALLAQARAQTIPGVGPVLLPSCGDDDDECCGGCGDRGCGHGRCRGRCGSGRRGDGRCDRGRGGCG